MLPIPISNGILLKGANKWPIVHTTAMSIELAIQWDPSIIAIQQYLQEFNCNIVPKTLIGCYNCVQGAQATIWCKSDILRATAQITCSKRHFILQCTDQGTTNEIRLFFNTARVKEQCNAQCGNHSTIMEIVGTLNYVNGIQPFWKYTKLWTNTTNADNMLDINWDFPDITHFFNVCKTFYIYTVAAIVAFSSAVFITVTYLCACKTKTKTSSSSRAFLTFFPLTTAALIPLLIFKIFFKIALFCIRVPFRILRTFVALLLRWQKCSPISKFKIYILSK